MIRNQKKRIIEVLIFLCCYIFTLLINIILGFGSIAFGNLVVYSIIFCLLECIQLFFLNRKIQAILFFVNIYFVLFNRYLFNSSSNETVFLEKLVLYCILAIFNVIRYFYAFFRCRIYHIVY